MDLKTALYMTIQRNPDREAVVEGDKRYTRAQWGRRVYGLANSLRRLGVSKGDGVAIALKNHEQTVTSIMALHCIGAVAVMGNPKSVPERIKYFVNDSGAKGIIFEKDTANVVNDALLDLPKCNIHIQIDLDVEDKDTLLSFDKLIEEGDAKEPDADISEDDLGILIYTSGTTGEPKGVPLTHRMSFHRAVANCVGAWCQYNSDTPKVIGLMPLFHTVGIHGVFLHALFYDGVYFPVPDFNPEDVISLIGREKITYIFASATHFHMMVSSDKWDRRKMSSVRYAMYGGAPMPEAQLLRNVKEFTRNFGHSYGCSEMYFMAFLMDCSRYPGAVGSTIFHNFRVIKLGGSPEDVVKEGDEGEFIADLRSPEAFKGYWNKPAKTAEVCRNGWYYTRDSAVIKGGFVYITGRTDDMIISGAENIHPAEVEGILLKHPDVIDAGVIGVPDEKWGQVVKAFIVSKNKSLTGGALDKFFKEDGSVESWKRPKLYQFIDTLPRTPSGKVQRFLLRDMK